MEALPPTHLLLLCIFSISALQFATASSFCPPQPLLFVTALQSQCPLSIPPSPPLEVDGESLDRILSSDQRNVYTSVFFYASWCPLSRRARFNFDVLSFMFPQITHLMLEESSVMPIIFSRYGVHSLPALLMVNQTSRVRHSGSKDLTSLIHFYKRATGFEPVQYFDLNQSSSFGSEKSPLMWNAGPRETLRREPYLAFSLLFFCLKVLLYFFPRLLTRILAFWVSYGWHLNLGIFGETSQLLGRILQVISLKRVWTKLSLCKARNLHNSAKNARVWASSLASVSLGESSSNRSASLDS